jgi:hypothetical protein
MIVPGPAPEPPEHSPGARACGRTVRFRRVRAGLTLRRCAELMGVTLTRLSSVEQGAAVFDDGEFGRFNAAVREHEDRGSR